MSGLPEPGSGSAAFAVGDLERRRKRLVNFLAGISAGAGLFFATYYVARGWSSVLEPVFIVMASSPVLFGLVLAVSRYSSRTAAIYFVGLAFAILTFVSLQSGRYAGTHYFLLVIGTILPLLFGAGRWMPHVAAAALAASALLALEFTLPTYIYHNRPWLPQLRNPFAESLDIDADDVIFIVTIFILEGMLTSASYLAMKLAERAEAALGREFARSEALLRNLLPLPIADRLKDSPDRIIADEFSSVTVLFADLVGFTSRAATMRPDDVVRFLERVFGELDILTERHGLEKIKTIGDAYMVAGGMPIAGSDHTAAVAEMALDILNIAQRLTVELGETVSVRVGFHTGPAIAGVIGRQKPFYDVWGDTINIAERMQSSGVPGRIQTTADTLRLLHGRYSFEERGTVDVKGKGPMQVFFLTGRSPGRPASTRNDFSWSPADADGAVGDGTVSPDTIELR